MYRRFLSAHGTSSRSFEREREREKPNEEFKSRVPSVQSNGVIPWNSILRGYSIPWEDEMGGREEEEEKE